MHNWDIVIGIETHVQLRTNSKIFSQACTAFGAKPNSQASFIDLALPGTLPIFNHQALQHAIRFGLAINAKINQTSVFDRKNYFYPDSPKGYQISQFNHPIVGEGLINITLDDGSIKPIRITRAHLEEDAGKSIHDEFENYSAIDLNRAGTPLLEIVTEPDITSSSQAVMYAKTLHTLVTWIEICDGNMQEGSFRCDANVSVKPKGSNKLGTRCEIKNLNSFKFLQEAIDYEVMRHIEILEDGGSIRQETRLYDPNKKQTRTMRSKEDAQDYRYFADPDLLPVYVSNEMLDQQKQSMPLLPHQIQIKIIDEYSLSQYDAVFVTQNLNTYKYFEQGIQYKINPKILVNWMMGEIATTQNNFNLDIADIPITPNILAKILKKLEDAHITHKSAKQLFQLLWQNNSADIEQLIEQYGLKQMADTNLLNSIIENIVNNNSKMVQEYQQGKEKAFNALVGQVMKETKGKASPTEVQSLLQQFINKLDAKIS